MDHAEELVNVVEARKHWRMLQELAKDDANGPHVDRQVVAAGAKKQLWRPVPTRRNRVAVLATRSRVHGGEAKVAELENTVFV